MSFRPEPAHQHGTLPHSAIVLVNLGTPDAPRRGAVRRYLMEFLSDPRVVEIPRFIWWWILNLFILTFRPGKSAKKYELIWTREGSPLLVHTQKQAALLQSQLAARGHNDLTVTYAMRYGSPSMTEVLDRLKAEGCQRVAILPAYPQYSGTTTASVYDAVFDHYRKVRNLPELRLVRNYHDHHAYIGALADAVRAHWHAHGRGEKLVLSFHGVPKRTLLRGDPYHCECHKTARLLAQALHLKADEYVVTFQSRFGRAEWLQPYTQPTLEALARDGVRKVDVMCPGFIADCLETLEEINLECKHAFEANGGEHYAYIPCLNENPVWIEALAEIAEQHVMGWPTMQPASQREELKRDAEAGRIHALDLGAAQ
ncbi:MAG TPA: ferrochelatase [Telluria sp.]|nr:ferrochelatase [Telluria sp.]